ncbi:hypothetical protein [Clostridium formicaceticum]|uniref:Uncharacterized protein n=1 Tax=Clostridium formicaceticum TaxID=1497 RepID=A0AAC9WH57_9CLOT|nr:hypothetical protein [Clostridium formicaceticum]AOY76895.1 hypothetical protein BJL90_14155 [Clostridium formicaceticum]ARE87375.1 hypothetical protein CLFO_17750 [Clostridium formicaceticum]
MKHYGKGYVFIYNPQQKDFYISEGCKLIDSDIHRTTKKQFWVFEFDDTEKAYSKWCTRKVS